VDKYVFVDTWAWLALSNRKDVHHKPATKEYEDLNAAGYRMVTSDYVLDEMITALFRSVAFGSAVQFSESLFAAVYVFSRGEKPRDFEGVTPAIATT